MSVTTDLPDKAVLSASITSSELSFSAPSESTVAEVENGKATLSFSNDGTGFPNDEYTVSLNVAPIDQPEDLKSQIGELGENLDGDNVRTNEYHDPKYKEVYLEIPVSIADSDVVIQESEKTEADQSAEVATLSEGDQIASYIRSHVRDSYTSTSVDSITINEDLGTDAEGDYIALVNLTWDVKNTAKTSEEMLELYSNDLAASLANDQPNVQEVAIFWKVPYQGDATSKWSFERKGDSMYLSDKVVSFG